MTPQALLAWREVASGLPTRGRHLTATWDDEAVVLYQAYPREIGEQLLHDGGFGGPRWRLDRTSKLRTSFTDLMSRCDRDPGEGREVVLGLRVRHHGFEALLRQAVHAVFPEGLYPNKQSWRLATRHAQVLLHWSAAPGPDGAPLAREVARLGLRDHALRQLSSALVGIDDLTPQMVALRERGIGPDAAVPNERPYPIDDALRDRLVFGGGS